MSPIHLRHLLLAVARSRHLLRREGRIERCHILASERHVRRADVLVQVLPPLGPRDRHDIRLARSGAGLTLADDRVRGDVARGELVPVLEEFSAPFPGFYLYYPQRRHAARQRRSKNGSVVKPYGAIFIMRADGTDKRQLTDSPWEDGMPRFVSKPGPTV